MEIGGDALGQLPQLGPVDLVENFRLPGKDDLEHELLVDVDVGEHPELLQHLELHVLGFVDDQHRAAAVDLLVAQEIGQDFEELDLLLAPIIQIEGQQDPVEQGSERGVGVGDQADGGLRIHHAQKAPDEDGLARADLAADQGEAGFAPQAVLEDVEGRPVMPAQVKKVGVGDQGKRFLAKSVKIFIHPRTRRYLECFNSIPECTPTNSVA